MMDPATEMNPQAAVTPAQASMPRPAVDRALAYGWLAGLFAREPDAETLDAYAGVEWQTLFDALSAEPALAPTIRELRGKLYCDSQGLALDLAVMFGKLFYGVSGPKTVPPYESAYVSARGILFQEPVSELNKVIADLGLSVEDSFTEPADHLAVELALMSEMARRLDAAEAQGDFPAAARLAEAQRALLDDHLLVWLPEFRDGCVAQAPDSLYAAAAESLLGYARQDRDWLGGAPE